MAETVATPRNVPRFRTSRFPGFFGGGGIQEDVEAPAPVASPATSSVATKPSTGLRNVVIPGFGDDPAPASPQGLNIPTDPYDRVLDPGYLGQVALGFVPGITGGLGINNSLAVNAARREAQQPFDLDAAGKLAVAAFSPKTAKEDIFAYEVATERFPVRGPDDPAIPGGDSGGGDSGGYGSAADQAAGRSDLDKEAREGLGSNFGGSGREGGNGGGNDDAGNSQGGTEGMSESDASGVGFARGGLVSAGRLRGPDPKGPDDGSANLDIGEFVIPSDVVKAIGADRFRKLIADVRAQESKGK